ncbi:MAG: tail fiber domain-containing protein, partial [Bacteroidales bacterium]|nr:tail fiber domain-containing protein [Bacteroidales bacterium]
MKSLKLLIIAVLVAFNTNAQVKVLTNGNCGIGTTSPATKLEVTGGQFQISGKNNIYLKDEINANDPGDIVFYGGSTELGRIWRYGTGMYIRAKNSGYGAIRILSSNENVGIGYNASSSYKLVIGGDVYAYGSYLPSDKRLKKNIVNISAPIDNILRLQGIKYEYDIDKIKELNKSKQKGIN